MNDYNPEYDDEAGMADNNLETLKRAVDGIDDVISTGDNLPEWCQEKIAVAKSMLVTVWDYMRSEEERGAIAEGKKSRRDPIRTIKTKGPNKIDMEKARKQAAKKKKKKSNYSESLEIELYSKLKENREMKNWRETPGRIIPAESRKPKVSEPQARREGDEWVVMLAGKMYRISTDEASTREEAIAIAKSSAGIREASEKITMLYIDGKPSTKYTKPAEAKKDAERLRAKFPKKKIEIKSGVSEARYKFSGKTGGMERDDSDADQRHGLYVNGKLVRTYNTKDEAENVKRRDPKFKDATVKKIAEQKKGWTHDTLAAQLFEQDLTYEDELNRMLKGKLKK